MSGKMTSSSKWTSSQLLNTDRTNPAWNDLTKVMRTSSEEFGLVGKRSEHYETAITHVMNQFDALKPLVNDEAVRLKVGGFMIHNLQSRIWSQNKRQRKTKTPSRQKKLKNNKKKGLVTKALNKREKDESIPESQVKVRQSLRKSAKTPASDDSQSPGNSSKLLNDAEKLLLLRRPLSTWKRMMALMRMTSDNLGVAGLQDEKSSVAIAGIMANFQELRPHMDDVNMQKKIRRQMINNLNQRLYHEKKKDSLECSPKMKKTAKKQRRKKGALKVKSLKMSSKAKEDKPMNAKKVVSASIQTLPASATKKLESTQLISELSVKAKQLLFYHHPPYSYQRLRKMMRQTGDQLGLAGLRRSEGLTKIVQILETFPQLQPYTSNVHVLKKLQSQMIMNFHQRKRNRLRSQMEEKENSPTVKKDDRGKITSNPEEEVKNAYNSARQVSASDSKQQVTEVTQDTAMNEEEEDIPLAKIKDQSKIEKDGTCESEKEECVSGDEKKSQGNEDEKNLVANEDEDVSVEEDEDGTIIDKEEVLVMENKERVTFPEKGGPDKYDDNSLTAKHTENDTDKMGNGDRSGSNEEEGSETDSDRENAPPATENKDVPVMAEKTGAGSEPSPQTLSERLSVGKSSMKISKDVKQLLVHHRPYATWKQLRDLMRITSDELGLDGLRDPAAWKSVKQIMIQIPQLEPYKDAALLQQRLQKQMITNLSQRILDHKKRKLGTYQPKENVLPTVTKWRQTQLIPVKRKNLKDITENNKIVKPDEVSEKTASPEPGKCWCQKGRAALWTHNDILHRTSGSLPWRHLMNVMRITSSALNVNKKSSENYEAAVLEVMNHFPGLKKVAGNERICKEVGKRMIKNYNERCRAEMKRKRGSRPTLKGKEKNLKIIAEEIAEGKKKKVVRSDDHNSENNENVAKPPSKRMRINTKKCWCQKKDAPVWTYSDLLVKKIGNVAWKHFTKIMQLTAHRYKVTRTMSTNYNTAVTEVLNHFSALRPYVDDTLVRRQIGKKMIKNYFRLSKRHGGKVKIPEAENPDTEKGQQDMQISEQKPEYDGSTTKMEVDRKKCWCQKKGTTAWTYNDILMRTTGNIAWKHFTKIMQLTARSHNITKRTSAKYDTAVTQVMKHFPALRPFINDPSVRREIGSKMISNYYRLSKRHASQSPKKDTKSSTTEKKPQDVDSNTQKKVTEQTTISKFFESSEGSRSAPVNKIGVKKCWCQKGESSTWTCNELLNRTPGNMAWKHFTKVLLDTTEALNVTRKSSENYQTAVLEVMNHFPALRTRINDSSIKQKIGDKMVNNSLERARRQAIREKTKTGTDEGLDATTEKTEGDGKKTDSIKEPQIFEVEAVLKYAKDLEGGEWYYVKWAGYASDQNTWEPKEHLTGCSKLLKKFHHQLKRAKLTHSGRKRKLSDDGLVVGSKKPKWPKPVSPVSTEAVRAMVQEELRNWAISLNYICTDTAPIVVENDVDFEGPPTEFNYINDYISGAGVKIPNDPLVGCECESCSEEELECCPQNSGVKFAYNRLKHIRVKPGTPIYECNKYCKCGEKCPNRVVQLGRKYPMAIFRTSNGRGWGVKTLVDIRRNTFVMEYVGEVITNEEAERRGKEYDANGRTYLFDLDYNDDDCPFTVDAGKSGNISHFVNHSCEPNLVVYGVWVNCVDPRLPRIALFANRDIKAGEELTFDYQMTGEVGDLSPDVKVQHVTCRCGASNCRGFLV